MFNSNSITLAHLQLGLSFSLLFLLSMSRMQDKGKGVKKIGRHKVIHSQSKEMVISVYSFANKEADIGNVINVNHIQKATGVSISTLKHILKEYELNK